MAEIAKTCPECETSNRLVVRVNSHTNQKFLGCPNYPKCTYTEELPLDLELRMSGAPTLEGFE